ncbi:hypothetical protein AHMF7605_22565 [Adhaeribacter arboris]|uniref:Uncharacterized protein n=1 Tax=Adhaeribacter arboris TaxID=2072846 RepID=A0A2T2YKT9_9BACT|nr:hypothetical protein [Adhaeribacter arboris]PSR56085.1 hypothetical protein AHMF7605_22565 [Adhaeribacter arboris]
MGGKFDVSGLDLRLVETNDILKNGLEFKFADTGLNINTEQLTQAQQETIAIQQANTAIYARMEEY